MIKEKPKVFINILVWNEYDKTRKCIESCKKINYANLEILLIDNNSTNDCLERILKEFPWISYIKNTSNLGYAGGNNIGIDKALKKGAKYIFILNNDTEILDENIINDMVFYMEKYPEIGALGPNIYNVTKEGDKYAHISNSKYYHFLEKIGLIKKNSSEINEQELSEEIILFGAAMMLSSNCLKKTGFFNFDCFLYGEESDLCMRIRNNDFLLYKLKKSSTEILHHHYKSNQNLPIWISFLMARNRFLALRQFNGCKSIFIALLITITSLREAVKMVSNKNIEGAKGTLIGVIKGWRILIRDGLKLSKLGEYADEAKVFINNSTVK